MLVEELQHITDILEFNINLARIQKEYGIACTSVSEHNAKNILDIPNTGVRDRDKSSLIAMYLKDETEELYRAMNLAVELHVINKSKCIGRIIMKMNSYYMQIYNITKYDEFNKDINSFEYYTIVNEYKILNKPRLLDHIYESLIFDLYSKIANRQNNIRTKKLKNLQKYKIIDTLEMTGREMNLPEGMIDFPEIILYIIDNSNIYIISSDCKLYEVNPKFKINTKALRKSNTNNEEVVFKIRDLKSLSDILIERGDISTFVDIREIYSDNIITSYYKGETIEEKLRLSVYNTPDIYDVTGLLRKQLPNSLVMINMHVLSSSDYKYSYNKHKFIRGNNDRPLELMFLDRNNRVVSEIFEQLQLQEKENNYE